MNGQFKPCMWNYFAHSDPRTNNRLEEWHNKLKRIARNSDPNFYKVLELFQKEQVATEVTIYNYRWEDCTVTKNFAV